MLSDVSGPGCELRPAVRAGTEKLWLGIRFRGLIVGVITMREKWPAGSLAVLLGLVASLALPGQRGAAQGAPEPEEPKKEGEPAELSARTQRILEKALEGCAVRPSLSGEIASLTYQFSRKSAREFLDWIWPRKADRAGPSEVNEGAEGFSVGAGTNTWAKAVHKVEFGPPCSMELDFLTDYNGPTSYLLVTLCEPTPGKGLAVDWGRQLVRKGGKPGKVAGPPARADFRSGHNHTIRVEVREGEIAAAVDGVETLRVPLSEKETAPGKAGFEIHDARVIFRTISLQGRVSMDWAEKEAAKAGSKKARPGLTR